MMFFKRFLNWIFPPVEPALPPEPPPPPAPAGLQKRWTVGQQLPWDGIWFEVVDVQAESITLKPTGTTWQRHKKITGRKKS